MIWKYHNSYDILTLIDDCKGLSQSQNLLILH